MKIFKIMFNEVGWDDYVGFIVLAKSRKEVVEFLKARFTRGINWDEGYKITEVKAKGVEPKIILDSFNAG